MDDILPQLLSFPPHPPLPQPLPDVEYDKQIKNLLQFLSQLPASKLTRGVSNGGDLLDMLDPSINTLPYLYALLAHVGNTQSGKQSNNLVAKGLSPDNWLWLKMMAFMDRFDRIQVRYAGHLWRQLLELVAQSARATLQPFAAIQPIRTAMLRLDPTTSCFTSTHALFVRLCLEARAYRQALPIIDNDLFHFPVTMNQSSITPPLLCADQDSSATFITTMSGLTDTLHYQDHMQYFLHGAILYLKLGNWDRALWFLECVIISPAKEVASMIQVEAYKKWTLVCLMLYGIPLPVPKSTNLQAAKQIRAIAKPYDAFATIFKEGNIQKLQDEFHAGEGIWKNDCNTGLLLQVFDAFRRFSVMKLNHTFAAISIPDVAHRTSPNPADHDETEAYLESLISSGHLNATVIHSSDPSQPSILRFGTSSIDGPDARSEAQMHAELVLQKAKISMVAEHMQQTDRKLKYSNEYVAQIRRAKNTKGSAAGSGRANAAMYDLKSNYEVDEDIMADI